MACRETIGGVPGVWTVRGTPRLGWPLCEGPQRWVRDPQVRLTPVWGTPEMGEEPLCYTTWDGRSTVEGCVRDLDVCVKCNGCASRKGRAVWRSGVTTVEYALWLPHQRVVCLWSGWSLVPRRPRFGACSLLSLQGISHKDLEPPEQSVYEGCQKVDVWHRSFSFQRHIVSVVVLNCYNFPFAKWFPVVFYGETFIREF